MTLVGHLMRRRVQGSVAVLLAGVLIAGAIWSRLPHVPAVSYPLGWPIKELTALELARAALLRYSGSSNGPLNSYYLRTRKAEGSPGDARTEWQLGFTYHGSRQEVLAHVENCLKPLGYFRLEGLYDVANHVQVGEPTRILPYILQQRTLHLSRYVSADFKRSVIVRSIGRHYTLEVIDFDDSGQASRRTYNLKLIPIP